MSSVIIFFDEHATPEFHTAFVEFLKEGLDIKQYESKGYHLHLSVSDDNIKLQEWIKSAEHMHTRIHSTCKNCNHGGTAPSILDIGFLSHAVVSTEPAPTTAAPTEE